MAPILSNATNLVLFCGLAVSRESEVFPSHERERRV